MKIKNSLFLVLLVGLSSLKCEDQASEMYEPPTAPDPENVLMYLSTSDETSKFALQENGVTSVSSNADFQITLSPHETYQTMDGYGFTLTGGSATLIHQMSDGARGLLLKELFGQDDGEIGISYLRLSIGASDLDSEVFSYNDLAAGQTDPDLNNFSIDKDRIHLLPVLKEILAINPNIKLMASPWSPPTWMKSNGQSKGGILLTEYYDAYAMYFVKYIEAMAAEGVTIDAITIQNEPLHPGNNPSMSMSSAEQAAFIKASLGPTFESEGIATKIILYDHNPDHYEYPIHIMDDEDVKQYVDGSAFHLYGGSIDKLSLVHNAHPDKNLYFTEQWIGAPGNFGGDLKWHARELLIGATRNWCKTVLEWNLASDPNLNPHTDGGCTECLGGVTIDGNDFIRNPGYYIIAHASKYVRPGSVRIGSSSFNELPSVAFQNQDQIVIIVLNNSEEEKTVNFQLGEKIVYSRLPAGAVATYVWNDINT